MPDFSFRPKSGRFGTNITLNEANIPAASPLTASATVTYTFNPNAAARRGVLSLSVAAMVVPAGGAAITATIKKWSVAAQAFVALATSFNLATLTAKQGTAIPFDTGVTTANRTLEAGDVLYVDLVCAGTVTTQPTNLAIVAETALLT